MRRNRARTHSHSGLTLLEMLLVLAVVVAFVAIAWPSMQRVYSDLLLKESVEEVRKELAGGRIRAIDSGLTYQFRYEPGGRRFIVMPYDREPMAGPQMASSTTAGPLAYRYSGELPEGLTFRAATSHLSISEQEAARRQQFSGRLAAEWLAGLPDSGRLAEVNWSTPILFYADGSAENNALEVVDSEQQYMVLAVRSLTGTVTVSDVQYEQRR